MCCGEKIKELMLGTVDDAVESMFLIIKSKVIW